MLHKMYLLIKKIVLLAKTIITLKFFFEPIVFILFYKLNYMNHHYHMKKKSLNRKTIVASLLILILPSLIGIMIWGYRAGIKILPLSVASLFGFIIEDVRQLENKSENTGSDILQKQLKRLRITGCICFVFALGLAYIFG